MAIKFKGTETSGLLPTGLGERELALNLTDKSIYSVDSLSNIIEFIGTDTNDSAIWGNITGTLSDQSDLNSRFTNLENNKEDYLGNPSVDGLVLSSTALGVRSWVAGGGTGQTDFNIDGGTSSTVYTAPQFIDGGLSV